jgi:hypothetical protein
MRTFKTTLIALAGAALLSTTAQAQTTDNRITEKTNVHALTEMNVFPNPARDSYKIAFETSQPGTVSIAVYDLLGKEVITRSVEMEMAGKHVENFYDHGMNVGAYIIKISSNNYNLTRKLIISNK